ncbi:HAD-IIA family hydrolase [Cohnella xylanilytica]|uniref:HAD-IIA family hydrolase n=1 Tax=Cohnella xylanilytica TaxID=557555 RepID=UPI001BB4035C|nr:HAD-IIA family hydrolase [Cohnella xylanilytica]
MDAMFEGFIIDLDGTVYRGRRAIEGAAEAIARLKRMGKRVVFLSNRGNYSREMCAAKLRGMGVEAREEEIVLSSTVAALYLKRNHPRDAVWTLGDEGLRDELRVHGVSLAAKPEAAEWLVITLHETLTYRDLNEAFRAVRHGARILATNADRSFPGDDGEAIDVAGMIGAIEAATGRKAEVVIGKPSRLMAEAALEALGLPAERCLVVGDSLASDIAMGRQAGIAAALVLTGSVSREEAEAAGPALRPDWIWSSLAELPLWLEQGIEAAGGQSANDSVSDSANGNPITGKDINGASLEEGIAKR